MICGRGGCGMGWGGADCAKQQWRGPRLGLFFEGPQLAVTSQAGFGHKGGGKAGVKCGLGSPSNPLETAHELSNPKTNAATAPPRARDGPGGMSWGEGGADSRRLQCGATAFPEWPIRVGAMIR